MGPYSSPMMPSASKPAYLFQPNPFAIKPLGVGLGPSFSELQQYEVAPDGTVWPKGDMGKKNKKLQKKSMPNMPSANGNNSTGASSAASLRLQEPILDEKSRELVALMELYRQKELAGEPL